MNAKLINAFAMVAIFMLAVTAARAQSSYSNEISSLNPVGYWPMHEVAPAASGDVETNYGTLGTLGNGYYPDWASSPAVSIKRQFPGPMAGNSDPDTALNFTHTMVTGSGVEFTNGLYVPHTSPLTTLNPPFTVECWFDPTNLSTGVDVWAQNGEEGLNAGNEGGVIGYIDGIRMVWVNSTFVPYGFDNQLSLATQNSNKLDGGGSPNEPSNQWYQVVVTCDANTNVALFVNGNQVVAPTPNVGKYSPDYWTPLSIGSGLGQTRSIAGYLSEFSVYTNVLQDIAYHYYIGTNASPQTNYFSVVTNDNPVIYLRMQSPTYTAPSLASWPTLENLGMTNGLTVSNGVYSPGTIPGNLTGPSSSGGVPFGGMPNNSAQLSGVSSFADAGSAPAYNPTGSNTTFSVTALFKGYPCDGRIQSIAGHGTNSWQLSLTTNGCIVFNAGNGNKAAGGTSQSAGDISTVGVYNDGRWHQVVAVNATNVISIYVDGMLDTNGTPNGITATNIIFGNANDVMIGSDPTYTNIPAGVGRSFAGQICDVAFFSNALNLTQVQALYNVVGVPPSITTEPVAATAGDNTAFTNLLIATGNTPLYYQWYTNNVAIGSSVTNIRGAVTNGVTTNVLIINPVLPIDNGNYYVVVSNLYGSATSAVVNLTVYTTPAIVSQFPITYNTNLNTNSLTVYAGANPAFSVSAVGAPTLGYQWFTNGVGVGGGTNTSLTLTNVHAGTINTYCVVTNFLGQTTSAVWSAFIIADPLNSLGGLAAYPQSVLALNPIGYWRLNEPDDGNYDGNPGAICHDYAGGNNAIYDNVYLGNIDGGAGYNPTEDPSDSSAQFGFYANINSDANDIGTNIDFSAAAGNNVQFSVECWVNFYATNTCGLVTKGYGNGGEEFALYSDSNGGTNYGFTHRFLVRNSGGIAYAGNCPAITLENTWYHLVGVCDEANSNVLLYVNGKLVSYTNTPAMHQAGIFNDISINAIIGARSASVNSGNNDQTIGYMNDVALFNYALSPGQIANEYDAGGGTIAPYFLPPVPATNAVAAATTTLAIPVTAVGTPPIGYVWTNLTTSATIATGATNATSLNAALNYGNVPLSWNSNQLELIVTNAYGMTNLFFTLSITNGVNPSPTNIVFAVTNNQLHLSWPADHTGWQLQAQTNSLSVGISTNWVNVSGSTATNQVVVPLNLANGSVFYRLTY